MTDRSKFEQMLEYLINEDEAKARELFHDIVVSKSREIYEELISEDFTDENQEQPLEDPMGEKMGAGDETDGDGVSTGGDEGEDEFGGEEGDDMGGDIDLSGSEVDELNDRVDELEMALDALRDELADTIGGEEGDDMGGDLGDEEDEELPETGMEMPPMASEEFSDEQFIREYTEKVTAKMGDNGANTKSVVAKANNMGGTAGNLNQAFEEKGKGGTQGGLANPSTKEENFGNVNVPGGKAGVKHLKNVPGGHGAEKKGSKPDSEKSLLGR